jgi:hypothetical protein
LAVDHQAVFVIDDDPSIRDSLKSSRKPAAAYITIMTRLLIDFAQNFLCDLAATFIVAIATAA